ncbi:MAG: DNA-processing protein DprA [Actinobacteria bacterium]|nr:DNA-processing protein DprA [Actinomycetota bacterium]
MAIRSDTSLASLLLTQRLVDGGAPPLKASEYWGIIEAVGDPAKLLGLDAPEIGSTTGAEADLCGRIVRRLDAATSFAFALDQAEQLGVRVLSALDDDYPSVLRERLGRGAPPLLYIVGDPSLLGVDLLGVVGSRDVSEAAAEVARRAAVEAVEHRYGVVSGAAKGADQLAMLAALNADGVAVGVLADSLARATRDPDVRRAVADGRLCLCTPYNPSVGFSVANAMGRNKLIYALSRATLVVVADLDRGGTWAGAVEALRQRSAPVLVWTGEGAGEGNRRLVERGALGVERISELFPLPVLGAPDASAYQSSVRKRLEPPEPAPEQLALDV